MHPMRRLRAAIEADKPTKRFRAQVVAGCPLDQIGVQEQLAVLTQDNPVHQQLLLLEQTFGTEVALPHEAPAPAVKVEVDPTVNPKCGWWTYPSHVQEALRTAKDCDRGKLHQRFGPHHLNRR